MKSIFIFCYSILPLHIYAQSCYGWIQEGIAHTYAVEESGKIRQWFSTVNSVVYILFIFSSYLLYKQGCYLF